MLASCGDKKTENTESKKTDGENTENVETPKTDEAPKVVAHSKISASVEGLTKSLDGDAFVKKDVNKETEYYLVYFTASW